VYVNYGRIEDFRLLESLGVNMTGTIALVRYGENFRGLKVTAAEKFGCVGALIYSDPIDDGPVGKNW
jgi:N-acetylated-alpha-linked acidic dipeptidase